MNNRELQLVSFEQAKRLKIAGFDWYCNKKYAQWRYAYSIYSIGATGQMAKPGGDEYFAPTVSLALKWFRDEKKINNGAFVGVGNRHIASYYHNEKIVKINYDRKRNNFTSHEAAESALLDELLNLIEKL